MREVLAGVFPVDARGRVVRTDGRGKRPWRVDVLCAALGFVVEFDGSYWHSEACNPGKAEKDREKAADIRSQGFTVVRVRESPLEALDVDDLVVELGLTGAEIGERVLAHLVGLSVAAEEFEAAS